MSFCAHNVFFCLQWVCPAYKYWVLGRMEHCFHLLLIALSFKMIPMHIFSCCHKYLLSYSVYSSKIHIKEICSTNLIFSPSDLKLFNATSWQNKSFYEGKNKFSYDCNAWHQKYVNKKEVFLKLSKLFTQHNLKSLPSFEIQSTGSEILPKTGSASHCTAFIIFKLFFRLHNE